MIFNENTFKELLNNMLTYHRNMYCGYKKLMKTTYKLTGYSDVYFHYKNECDKHMSLSVEVLNILNCYTKQSAFDLWFDIYDPKNIKFKD